MTRLNLVTGLLASALTLASVSLQSTANAQTSSATTDYRAPRTSFSQPSLEGTWTQNFVIVMESIPQAPMLVLPEPAATKMAESLAQGIGDALDKGLDPEVPELMKQTDGLPLVRGERRTRAVILPADGKIPYTLEARKESAHGAGNGTFESYEKRPNWERCVTSLGLPPVSGVGTTSANPRQIIQLPGQVVIHTEYGDEARIIPLTRTHGDRELQPLLGDAIAWWEGETLVVETIRMPAADRVRFFSNLVVGPDSKVTERYTRLSDKELLYQYTVEDPSIYTAPWMAEYSIYKTDVRMFEHACHEGNHSLPNILMAARMKDERAKPAQ